jgi:hypothetical protein
MAKFNQIRENVGNRLAHTAIDAAFKEQISKLNPAEYVKEEISKTFTKWQKSMLAAIEELTALSSDMRANINSPDAFKSLIQITQMMAGPIARPLDTLADGVQKNHILRTITPLYEKVKQLQTLILDIKKRQDRRLASLAIIAELTRIQTTASIEEWSSAIEAIGEALTHNTNEYRELQTFLTHAKEEERLKNQISALQATAQNLATYLKKPAPRNKKQLLSAIRRGISDMGFSDSERNRVLAMSPTELHNTVPALIERAKVELQPNRSIRQGLPLWVQKKKEQYEALAQKQLMEQSTQLDKITKTLTEVQRSVKMAECDIASLNPYVLSSLIGGIAAGVGIPIVGAGVAAATLPPLASNSLGHYKRLVTEKTNERIKEVFTSADLFFHSPLIWKAATTRIVVHLANGSQPL